MQGCIFCGGDVSEPNHRQHCDGRQGQIEATPPLPPKLRVIRIVSPRETSVQAFYNAVDSGAIKTRREQVYAGLRAIGGGDIVQDIESPHDSLRLFLAQFKR
jgi:hypothetical protein